MDILEIRRENKYEESRLVYNDGGGVLFAPTDFLEFVFPSPEKRPDCKTIPGDNRISVHFAACTIAALLLKQAGPVSSGNLC